MSIFTLNYGSWAVLLCQIWICFGLGAFKSLTDSNLDQVTVSSTWPGAINHPGEPKKEVTF